MRERVEFVLTQEQKRLVDELVHSVQALPPERRAVEILHRAADDADVRREALECLVRMRADEAGDGCLAETNDRDVTAAFAEADPQVLETASLPSTPAATGPERRTPPVIDGYVITDYIGHGAMGDVWKAEQRDPRRIVAMKVIRAGSVSNAMMRRFRLEALALGRLQHPGIAQIFGASTLDVGEGAQPYFAMEFVDGSPLARYAESNALTVRERLELVARIAEAVQHAHHRSVIHRDLKPGNILVTTSGDPKVLDFGIARVTDSDVQTATLQTSVGEIMGTLPYMSPEQASGNPDDVDALTDVYALGVIAYELLSGELPLDMTGVSMPRRLQMIQDDEPAALRTRVHRLDPDVEIIVQTAMAKEKPRRYQSAGELAADITRHLEHRPVLARAPGTVYQLRKFTRRHTALVGGVAATLVVSVAAAVVSLMFALSANHQRQVTGKVYDFLITNTFSSLRPEQVGPEATIREVFDAAGPSIDEMFADEPEVRIKLHDTFGSVYRALNLYAEGESHSRLALELARETDPGNEQQMAALLGRLGTVLLDSGKSGEAVEYFRLKENLLSSEVEQLEVKAGNHVELGGIAHDFGDYELAELQYRAALDIVRTLDPEGWDVAYVQTEFSRLLADAGFLEESHQMADEGVRRRQRMLETDEDHPELAYALLAQAYSSYLLEDYAASVNTYREAMGMYRRLLSVDGNDDVPQIRLAEMDLAGVIEDALALGQAMEVRNGERTWAPDYLRDVGVNHVVGFSHRNRGRHLLRGGHPSLGNERFQKAVEAVEDHEGWELHEAHTRVSWARQLRRLGAHEAALEQAEAALALQAGGFSGGNQVFLAPTELEYGRILMAMDRHDEALRHLRTAVRLRREQLDATLFPVVMAELSYAECLHELDRTEEARPLVERGLRVLRAEFGVEHARTKRAQILLANLE